MRLKLPVFMMSFFETEVELRGSIIIYTCNINYY